MEKDPYAVLTAYQDSAVLIAAAECGLFDSLTTTAQNAADIAARARLPLKSTQRLLRALAACEYIDKQIQEAEPLYALNAFSKVFTETGAGGLARVVHKEAIFYRTWASMAEALKSQRAVLASFAERVKNDPDQVRLFLTALNDLAALAAPGILPHLDWAVEDELSILDAGGGAGGYAAILAQQFPKTKITLLDWPEILPIAHEALDKAGVLPQVACVAGDLRLPGLGLETERTFDRIFLSHVLHDYAADMAEGIVQKLATQLKPGGSFFILDVVEPPSGASESAVEALFDLMMLVENPGGCTHPQATILDWLTTSGLEIVNVEKLYFGSLFQAKKPGA